MFLLTAFGACLLAAPNASSQSGHEIKFPLREDTVVYEVRGNVLRTYFGGRLAPEIRRGELTGTYRVQLVNSDGVWTLIGVADECMLTIEGKELPGNEVAAAKLGKWTVPVDKGATQYTWNGEPKTPAVLGLPFWPVNWAPIVPENSMRIGDIVVREFELPLQSFLEDDPIGKARLPFVLRFDGPEAGNPPVYRFIVETRTEFDQKVEHPEDPDLKLGGQLSITGTIDVDRRDGRIESASLFWVVNIGLDGPNYPFGFSKCRLSATTTLKRMR